MTVPLFLSGRHRKARDRVLAALAAIDRNHRGVDFQPEAVYRELSDALDELQRQTEGET